MDEAEARQVVAEMKDRFSDAMEGHDMFDCLCALTEQLVELLLTMDDATPDSYDPFAVFADLYEEAFESAEFIDEIELLDETKATAH